MAHLISKIKQVNKGSIETNAWYSRNVARPISLYVTKPFIWMHPNIICFIMILAGLASLPFFYYGTYWSIIIGVIIIHVHYILDHVDGNVARLTNKKSYRGKYLDYVSNITVNPLVLIFLGIGIFNTTSNITYLYSGFLAGFFYLAKEPSRLFRYLMYNELNIKETPEYLTYRNGGNILKKLNIYASIILDYPGIMLLLTIFAIFGITNYLILFYGFSLPLFFIARTTYEFYFWKKKDTKK